MNLGDVTAATQCIADETGLSEACMACVGGIVSCGSTNCQMHCVGDQSTTECQGCLETNCYHDYRTCSGLEPTDG
jgi:hypothetical protein